VAVADGPQVLVDKQLIISHLQKILGSICAEDYKHLVDCQTVTDQRRTGCG